MICLSRGSGFNASASRRQLGPTPAALSAGGAALHNDEWTDGGVFGKNHDQVVAVKLCRWLKIHTRPSVSPVKVAVTVAALHLK